jgi:DNA-binding transcriptional ArsR family regulator
MDIAIDIDDPRTSYIADVISNKTCKKIISALAEKELSETDISKELKMPINTVGYNIKKLVQAGLIEKSSTYFWSIRGKKIPHYKLSNKKIVISPKKSVRGILPAVAFSAVAAAIIGAVSSSINKNQLTGTAQRTAESSIESDPQIAYIVSDTVVNESAQIGQTAIETIPTPYLSGVYNFLYSAPNVWVWFLIGALSALAVFMLWSYFKKY